MVEHAARYGITDQAEWIDAGDTCPKNFVQVSAKCVWKNGQ
jgi:hypothetical protein